MIKMMIEIAKSDTGDVKVITNIDPGFIHPASEQFAMLSETEQQEQTTAQIFMGGGMTALGSDDVVVG